MSRPRSYHDGRAATDAERARAYRQRHKRRRSTSVEWYTPIEWFEWFSERWGPFNVDPCASELSPIWPLVAGHLTREQDGLSSSWAVALQADLFARPETAAERRRRRRLGIPVQLRGQEPEPERRAFVNPPYTRDAYPAWTDRAYRAVRDGEVSVAALLVRLDPTTAWFKLALERGATYEPLPGRVRFHERLPDGTLQQTSGAGTASCALVFRDARPVTKPSRRAARA